MLRRSVATLILVASLWVATLAWSGFLALRTVFDAERSREVASELYEDDAVRDRLEANIAAAVSVALPTEAAASDAQIEQAAAQALDSPEVEAMVVDAFADTHAAFLGEGEAPTELDAGAFGAAARDAVVAARPELDGVLPPAPELAVALPTEHVPDAGPVKRFLERAVPFLATIAAAGTALALLATSDRPAVVRRAAYWALGMSAVVLVVAFGLPWAAQQLAPAQAEVIAALVGALAGATAGPALALGGCGLVGLLVAFTWRRAPSLEQTGLPAAPTRTTADAPRSGRGGRISKRTMPGRMPDPGSSPPPARRPAPALPDGPPTRIAPSPTSDPPPPAPPRATPNRAGGRGIGPRWVEGHGWVVDPASDDIPADARWVAGIGYVVEAPPER